MLDHSPNVSARAVTRNDGCLTDAWPIFVHRAADSVHDRAAKSSAGTDLHALERPNFLAIPYGLDGPGGDAVAIKSMCQPVKKQRPDHVPSHESLAEALHVFDGDIAVDLTARETGAAEAARSASVCGDPLSRTIVRGPSGRRW